MLPSVLRWNLPANAERQTRVSDAFGKPDVPAADLVAGLVKDLGLPRRLADVGAEVMGSTQEELGKVLRDQVAVVRPLVEELKLVVQ